jgi:nucleoid-associated protein YgaU
MDFYLTNYRTNQRIIFPMNPERVKAKTGAKMQTFSLPEIGDISVPKGQTVASISWEGTLPGEARKNMSFVKSWASPNEIVAFITQARDNGDKLRLLITLTPLNLDVFIDTFEHEWGGGAGDCSYSISMAKERPLKIYTEDEWRQRSSTTTQGITTAKLEPRPTKPTPMTYTVKAGDTLFKIAKQLLQKGEDWPKIYADPTNRKTIGPNPNLIYPGQVLIIPGGTGGGGAVIA